MKSKQFDAELKKDIVKLYLNGSQSYKSLANEIDVYKNTVYKWIRLYNADPTARAFANLLNQNFDVTEI